MIRHIRLIRGIVPDMARVAAHLEESFAVGRLSNGGPAARRLEGVLEERFGFRGAVLTSSGHAALLAAVGTSPARRWAVPAFTFESARLAVAGREVVFVDSDRYGFMDLDSLRRESFDALLAVCPISSIPDLRAIREIVGDREIVLDAAAAFGSPMSPSVVTCMSLHATKTLPIGEGGVVFGLDPVRCGAARRYLNFGLDANGVPSGEGTNGKLSDYAAAVGLALLDGPFEVEVAARLRNAARYRVRLGALVPPSAVGDRTVYQVLPVFFPTRERAERARRALACAGIEHKRYYRPIVPLPGAVDCYERNACLPVHGSVSHEEIDRICEVVLTA